MAGMGKTCNLVVATMYRLEAAVRISLANPACTSNTAQKIKFSIKDFFSKCDQIRSFLRIWSHLLKKSLMEKFLFLYSVGCVCYYY